MGQIGKGKEKGKRRHGDEHEYEAEQNVFRLRGDRPVVTEMATIAFYGLQPQTFGRRVTTRVSDFARTP